MNKSLSAIPRIVLGSYYLLYIYDFEDGSIEVHVLTEMTAVSST